MTNRGINEVVLTGIVYDAPKKEFSNPSNKYNSKFITKFIMVCKNTFSELDFRVRVYAIGKCADRANLIARHNAFVMVKGEITTEETIDETGNRIEILPVILVREISLLKIFKKQDFKEYRFRNVLMANDPNNYSEMTSVPKCRRAVVKKMIERKKKKKEEETNG